MKSSDDKDTCKCGAYQRPCTVDECHAQQWEDAHKAESSDDNRSNIFATCQRCGASVACTCPEKLIEATKERSVSDWITDPAFRTFVDTYTAMGDDPGVCGALEHAAALAVEAVFESSDRQPSDHVPGGPPG